MTENPTAKYIKFWFCVTFSALFFNWRHFRSGDDNLTYRSKLSLLYAFQENSSIGMFIVSEMTENPTAKYEKFWFRASLLINFGRRRLRCSYKLDCVANYASFSDLLLFQLKRTCLQKFKKSKQEKNI